MPHSVCESIARGNSRLVKHLLGAGLGGGHGTAQRRGVPGRCGGAKGVCRNGPRGVRRRIGRRVDGRRRHTHWRGRPRLSPARSLRSCRRPRPLRSLPGSCPRAEVSVFLTALSEALWLKHHWGLACHFNCLDGCVGIGSPQTHKWTVRITPQQQEVEVRKRLTSAVALSFSRSAMLLTNLGKCDSSSGGFSNRLLPAVKELLATFLQIWEDLVDFPA